MIRSVCLASLVGLASCGLIDSEADRLDFELPQREVVVDTGDWDLTRQGTIPAVECEATRDCASWVEMWCGADDICTAGCGEETCEINVLVELWHTFRLGLEQPELQEIAGQPLVSVTIERISFEVRENTLSLPSPELTMSVAPQGTLSIDGSDAERIGIVPPIEPGQTVSDADLELSRDGEAILAERLRDYQTPFNLILGGTLELRANDDVPTGRLVMVVRVSAHASVAL